jgi:hypothetical protein
MLSKVILRQSTGKAALNPDHPGDGPYRDDWSSLSPALRYLERKAQEIMGAVQKGMRIRPISTFAKACVFFLPG